MQQPVVRARGRYAADEAISAAAAAKGADAANLVCNKNFAAKRALTAGVFTVVCPHGTFLTISKAVSAQTHSMDFGQRTASQIDSACGKCFHVGL